MKKPIIEKAYLVSGQPHPYLAPDKSPAWKSLHDSYLQIREEIASSDADLIVYFSTQWLSVIGYLFQADPRPKWEHVDHNWHELGTLPYEFKVDSEFAKACASEVKPLGHNVACVNYEGFPIDTGTIVAQKFLNPDNRIPAAMISCNMYAEKEETRQIGFATARALQNSNKKAIAVLVSNLSNRFFTNEINPKEDHISSQKDDEWNQKICELLRDGRLEDVSQVAREFGREANADMGFKGVWWLNALCGETNAFKGKVFDYQPVWGTGAALIGLTPTKDIFAGQKKTTSEKTELENDSPDAFLDEQEGEKTHSKSGVHQKFDSAEAPEPVGAYPHARREGEFLFLSGVGPRKRAQKEIPGVTLNKDGEILSYNIETQTRSVIQNVKTILESAGSSLDSIVDIQVYLTNMKKDFQAFNKIYKEVFESIGATRTTIEVGALPTPIAVEFKVIARVNG